jgi:hypothetical protein
MFQPSHAGALLQLALPARNNSLIAMPAEG